MCTYTWTYHLYVFQVGERIVSDTMASYKFILAGLAVAMVLSFIFILLLRWFTGTIVWTSILAVLVLLSVGRL